MKWYRTGEGYTDASGRFRILRHKIGFRLTDTQSGDLFQWPTLREAKFHAISLALTSHLAATSTPA